MFMSCHFMLWFLESIDGSLVAFGLSRRLRRPVEQRH